jgi:hypothetical protein
MIKIPSSVDSLIGIEFAWGERLSTSNRCDCLGLAIAARRLLLPLADPLPELDWVYQRYTRETLPPRLVLNYVSRHTRSTKQEIPSVGDLAVVLGSRGAILGTVAALPAEVPMVLAFGQDATARLFQPAEIRLLGHWRID